MMAVSSSPWRTRLVGFLPCALVPVAFFWIARGITAWAGGVGREGQGDDTPKLSVCRHAELDHGAAQRTDLAAVRRAYATLKKDLEKTLVGQKAKAMEVLDLAHDSGLPRCGFGGKRSATLPEALPVQFRSRTFYFLRLDGGFEGVPWEGEIAEDARAEILVLAAKRPADAGNLAKRLKRPVTFATAELAKALGVTCGPAKVTVGENGRDLVIQEGR